MILYHGSNVLIDNIDLQRSKPNKDFGKGFYCSDDKQQALRMAELKSDFLGGEPQITSFEFDENILKGNTEFSVRIFTDYSKEWADFIFVNRNNPTDENIHPYDIIYGPIANDKVGLQIRKLEDRLIDKEEFLHRLKYMKGITFQYFFGTNKAIQALKKL